MKYGALETIVSRTPYVGALAFFSDPKHRGSVRKGSVLRFQAQGPNWTGHKVHFSRFMTEGHRVPVETFRVKEIARTRDPLSTRPAGGGCPLPFPEMAYISALSLQSQRNLQYLIEHQLAIFPENLSEVLRKFFFKDVLVTSRLPRFRFITAQSSN